MNRARLRCATTWHIFPSPLTWRNGWLERCQSSGLHTACLQQPVCNKPCSALSSIATFLISNKAKTIRALGQSYHHDVILQLAAAYGQLQVSHSSQLVLQRGAAVVYHIFHREVVCRGPALIVLVPGDGIRMDAGSWIYIYKASGGTTSRKNQHQVTSCAAVRTHLSAFVTRYTSVNNCRLMRSPKRCDLVRTSEEPRHI